MDMTSTELLAQTNTLVATTPPRTDQLSTSQRRLETIRELLAADLRKEEPSSAARILTWLIDIKNVVCSLHLNETDQYNVTVRLDLTQDHSYGLLHDQFTRIMTVIEVVKIPEIGIVTIKAFTPFPPRMIDAAVFSNRHWWMNDGRTPYTGETAITQAALYVSDELLEV